MGKNLIKSIDPTLITEKSPCGICIIDVNWKIVEINSVAAKFYGLKSKSEIKGKKILSFISREFRNQAEVILNYVSSTGKSNTGELKLVNKQKEELWVECKLSLLNSIDSGEKYFIQYFRDITAKKEIEDYLLNEKNKLEQLYDNLAIGLYRTSQAGKLLYANSAFAKIFGFDSVAEIYRISFSELLAEYKYPRNLFMKELKKKKNIVGFEVCIKLPGGEKKYIRENAKLIFDDKLKVLGVEGSVEDISDKVLMNNKLRESEESYRGLFNSIKEAVYIQDRQGKFLDINDGALKMYGYPKSAFIGNTPAFLSAPNKNDFLKLSSQIENAFNGIPQEFEFWGRRKNGEIFPKNVRLYKGKYFGQDCVIALAQDISEKLSRTKEIIKLSQAVEQSSAMVLITDKSGNIEYVNKKFVEITGYSLNDVINKNPRLLKYEETNIKHPDVWEKLIKGHSWKGEFVNRKKNGEKIYVSALISPLFDDKTDVINYLAIEEDITFLKYQQEKIERYQKLISGFGHAVQKLLTIDDFELSLIETLEVIAKSVDADRGYIFENSFDKVTCELLMNQVYEWVQDGIEPQINNPLLQRLNYKELGFDENYFRLNKTINLKVDELSGKLKNILESQQVKSMVAMPIFVNNIFWGFIGFDNCRKEMIWDEGERQILQAVSINIGRAIERETIKNELISAKNDAQKADKLKTEFLAQISHEIRSPLNIILNYSSLLREYFDDKSDPDVFEMFNGIHNAGSRIIRTIDLILNLAELQTGSYDFSPKELDLADDILKLLVIEYKNNARKKKLDLTYSLNTNDTKVFVDEYSITQVFANLLDNAIKYTNNGKIKVSICRKDDKNLIVEIEDTGIGISEEYLPNLFKPFRQEEQGYSRKYEGNGLGLSLVKKYCELNNADINVESKKGKGTRFKVSFH